MAPWVDPAEFTEGDRNRRRILRDKLHEKIRVGKEPWTRNVNRGDEVAVYLGLEPFVTEPDATRFDPMREPTWSLMMALAWIIDRTPEAVRDHWEDYRAECQEWGPWMDGWREHDRRPPAELEDLKVPGKAAVAMLTRELRDGRVLRADGKPPNKARVEIPAREWRDLEIFDGARISRREGRSVGREQVYLTHKRGTVPVYEDVQISREALIALFPPHIETVVAEEAEEPALVPVEIIDAEFAEVRADEELQLAAGLTPSPEPVAETAAAPIYHTGAAGRPSSAHLILQELDARWANGERHQNKAAWAEVLVTWLGKAHPKAPPLKVRGATNAIRDRLNSLAKGDAGA